MDLLRLLRGSHALRRWAVASLVANIGIVVTGALVRLTGSGLGCPTWPRCTETSYVSHPALGLHGAIEFGNRMLTFVLVVVALGTWLSAFLSRPGGHPRRDLRWLAGGMALGIPAQAVIGGISVLTQLNPFIVALHLLVSMVLIALSVWLVRRTRDVRATPVGPARTALVAAAYASLWLSVWLGTVVTGSGPHAGDEFAPRTGFDGGLVTHLHSGAVYLTVALTVAGVVALRSWAAMVLLAVELGQAAIGVAQYNLGLPIGLVLAHLLGASLAVAAATNLFLSIRRGPRVSEPPGHTRVAVPAAAVAD